MSAERAERAGGLEIGNRTRHIGPVHYADEDFVLAAGAERRVAQTRNDGTSY